MLNIEEVKCQRYFSCFRVSEPEMGVSYLSLKSLQAVTELDLAG